MSWHEDVRTTWATYQRMPSSRWNTVNFVIGVVVDLILEGIPRTFAVIGIAISVALFMLMVAAIGLAMSAYAVLLAAIKFFRGGDGGSNGR